MNFQDAINAQSSGDIKKAEKIYKRLLSQDPNNFQIYFKLYQVSL